MIYIFDLFGIFVFAVSGALSAGKKSLDFFGVAVISVATALGGGTLRDLILGNTPVAWVQDHNYILVAVSGACLTIFLRKRCTINNIVLVYADAFGLALFTVIGTQVAIAASVSPVIAIIMGVMTGTFGGLLRDVMTNEIPFVLRKEIYATASFVGSISYLIVENFASTNISIIIAMTVTLILRIIAIRRNLSLPLFEIS
ncbi:trimeric intracellular cation channel family protein [Candidatus Uabimicrobium sp. HlEnr_7]|uniref:trimeric intracellular cation channel family protein n=1 Tax=Candidatus Uabimicrobium helgolandensis TaxID=3095367 RepID=UPI003556F960